MMLALPNQRPVLLATLAAAACLALFLGQGAAAAGEESEAGKEKQKGPDLVNKYTGDALARLQADQKSLLAKYKARDDVITAAKGVHYRVITAGPADGKVANELTPLSFRFTAHVLGDDDEPFGSTGSARRIPHKRPHEFKVAGLATALKLMRAGDEWEIVLAADVAFGKDGNNAVPQDMAVKFDFTVLEVLPEVTWLDIIWKFCIDYPVYIVVVSLALKYVLDKYFGIVHSNRLKLTADLLHSDSNPRVYLDIAIDNKPAGRIVLQLAPRSFPKTAENFRSLCCKPKRQGYKGSKFHRIIPKFMCQGGDFTKGDGTGGRSIYGEAFKDEFDKAYLTHDRPYLLSMANAGPDTNGSQFFITTAAALHLDEKHVAFGFVVEGKEVVDKMEACEGTPPSNSVVITDCGELKSKST